MGVRCGGEVWRVRCGGSGVKGEVWRVSEVWRVRCGG